MHAVGPVQVESRIQKGAALPQNKHFRSGIALCLSGGGYRAMLFHLGTLKRLNELQMLPELRRISSVSGGSILAAHVGLHWDKLHF